MSISSILVIGSGGVAGFYAALLHRVGITIDMVARSDHAIIQQHGLKVDSTLGDLSFRPRHVYASTNDAPPQQHVLVAIKLLDDIQLDQLLRPVVTTNTHIILLANGIDVEAPIRQAFPNNPLTSGVAFVSTSRVAPGHIRHVAFGRLLLGSFPDGISSDCQQLVEQLERSGIKVRARDNIVTERWKKSIWNASFNPLSAAANGKDTGQLLATDHSQRLVRALMTEVIEIARAEGHDLPLTLVDDNINNTANATPFHTSMGLDYQQQRPIELEALVGKVVHCADQHQLAIPHLRTVYEILAIRAASSP